MPDAENIVIFSIGFMLGVTAGAALWCLTLAPLYVRLAIGDDVDERRKEERGIYLRKD